MHFFDEIKSYVGFTESDATYLKQIRPILEPHFEEVVVAFYEALMAHPRARGIFVGPEQIERLRKSLTVWMGEVFGGTYDDAYFKQRRRIGRVHVEVGLLPQFMFGAMNLIRHQFVDILLGEGPRVVEALGTEDGPRLAVASMDRILDIELTVMVQSYWDILVQQKLAVPAALATGLAHEVRNPLNAIALQTTLLERKLRAAEVDSNIYEPVMEAVRIELRRIQVLNSEILDFAKPVYINAEPTNVREVVEEIQQAHQLTLDAGEIEMSVETGADVVVSCDRNRLSQVFVNLLTNAVEAMPGSGRLTVKIEGTEGGAVIEFIDTGQGMEVALQYQIFDLFHTTKASGTGIGLPIAKKIMEAHGGSIDVMSRPGQGTTFTLYLPRQR